MLDAQGEAVDGGADEGGGGSGHQCPAESGEVGLTGGRYMAEGEGVGAEAGPGAEAGEQEGADPGGEQSGHQDDAEQGSAEPGGLHQEERAEER